MSSVKRQLTLNLRVQFLFLGKGKSCFCGHRRDGFEGCLANIFLAVLDHTNTMVETQIGGQEEKLILPSHRKLNDPKWSPAVPLDLMIRHCEETSSISYNLNKVLKTMYTYYSHWKTFASNKELVWGESCYNNSLPCFHLFWGSITDT